MRIIADRVSAVTRGLPSRAAICNGLTPAVNMLASRWEVGRRVFISRLVLAETVRHEYLL